MSKKSPIVAIIMGSDSDLDVMSKAAKILDDLQIPYSTQVLSAHRTPEKMAIFAQTAESNGYEVIIAGAGVCSFAWNDCSLHNSSGDCCAD